MLRHATSEHKFVLREMHKSKPTSVTFSVDSRSERDLVLLAFRTFYCMGQPHVVQVLALPRCAGSLPSLPCPRLPCFFWAQQTRGLVKRVGGGTEGDCCLTMSEGTP